MQWTVWVSRMYLEEVTVGGRDEQQFSALTIEYYTCLSRLERCNVVLESVISSMTFPGRRWPQRWFILLWEASPSRQSFRRIFPRTKSKVAQSHDMFTCTFFLPSLKDSYEQLSVTGVTLMQILFYSSGSFIHNTNCNCMILEGNLYWCSFSLTHRPYHVHSSQQL